MEQGIQMWIDEKPGWTYGSGEFNHYTQVMWEGSKEVGCALYQKSGCGVVVCRYLPAGNVVGRNPW